MTTQQTPDSFAVDLETMISWLDEIAEHYEAVNSIHLDSLSDVGKVRTKLLRLRSILLGQFASQSTLDDIRLLVAGGMMQWRTADRRHVDSVSLFVTGLACAALWPLILAKNLPQDWPYALQEITSLELAQYVVTLREKRESVSSVNLALNLARAIATPSMLGGVRNLLEDFRDPGRGGAALIAIATARNNEEPPVWPDLPAFLKWLIVAAMGGIVGNRADDIVNQAWDWLLQHTQQESASKPDYRSLTPKEAREFTSIRRGVPIVIYDFPLASLIICDLPDPNIIGFFVVSADASGQLLVSSAGLAPRGDRVTVLSRGDAGPFVPPFIVVTIHDQEMVRRTTRVGFLLEDEDGILISTHGQPYIIVTGNKAAREWLTITFFNQFFLKTYWIHNPRMTANRKIM